MKKILLLLSLALFAVVGGAKADNITFTIVNNNPTEWSQLALYEWHDDGNTFGDWPGKVLYDGTNLTNDTEVTVTKSENTFTVTIAGGVNVTNLILNNNNNGKQMDLTDFANGKSYTIPAPEVAPEAYSTAIYFINSADWSEIHLYEYHDGGGPIYGGWPGVQLVNEAGTLNPSGNVKLKVTKVGKVVGNHDVYKIELGDGTGFVTLIFNNNNDSQSAGVDAVNGAYYNCTNKMANVSITPDKEYITYVTPTPLDFSGVSGLKAYKASSVSASKVTLVEVTQVPAGTPLVLKGTASTEYTVPLSTSASDVTGNLLQTGDGTTQIGGDGKYDYVLKDGQFHKANAGTVAIGKAYLHLTSAPSGARSLDIDTGDGTTGIQNTVNKVVEDNIYYNLNGLRIAQPGKGLYILNGKKYILK